MATIGTPKAVTTAIAPRQTGFLLLGSVVNLLRLAAEVLQQDQAAARRNIARAVSLLEAGTDFADPALDPERGRLAPWQVARVREFVEAHLTMLIRIQDLAALTRLSPSYFSRAFRATTGESPYNFVIRQRIERAKTMILREDKPLSQIALDCGLADQAHLTRLFHRAVGTSPSAWRRANRPEARDFGDLVPSTASSFNRGFDA